MKSITSCPARGGTGFGSGKPSHSAGNLDGRAGTNGRWKSPSTTPDFQTRSIGSELADRYFFKSKSRVCVCLPDSTVSFNSDLTLYFSGTYCLRG